VKFPVKQFMTSHPFTIGPDETAESAGRVMQTHGIHHLPVLRDGELVGMVSESDLRLSIAWSGASRPVYVRDAMRRDPFVVGPDSPMSPVARIMAEQRHDSAVVMSSGRVVGILCAFDALRALAELSTTRVSA
jgi:acetoin utilization protein AcuB